jgi:PKD repeat protein
MAHPASYYDYQFPRQYVVFASNDNSVWTVLDDRMVTGNRIAQRPTPGINVQYNFTNTNPYKYYMLGVNMSTPIYGTDDYYISELRWKYHDPAYFPLDPSFHIDRDGVNGEISQDDFINASSYYNDSVSALTGREIQFIDDSLGSPTGWTWGWGDGSAPSTTQNPTHTYTTAGIYNATLTVTKDANSATKNMRVYVSDAFEYAYLTAVNPSATYPWVAAASKTTWGNPAFAIDNSREGGQTTGWAFQLSDGVTHWLIIDFGAKNSSVKLTINEVTIYPASSYPQYTPFGWKLEASNDTTNWVLLENRTEDPLRFPPRWAAGVEQTWGFNNAVAYRYYRFTPITSGSHIQISELFLKYHNETAYVENDFYVNRSWLSDYDIWKYTLNRTVFRNEQIQFIDDSKGVGLTHKWDFNGDGSVDSVNATVNWTYFTTGVYTVNHTVTNSFGKSVTKFMYISAVDIIEPAYGDTMIDAGQGTGGTYGMTWSGYTSYPPYNLIDKTLVDNEVWYYNIAPPKWVVYDYGQGYSNLTGLSGWLKRKPVINSYKLWASNNPTNVGRMPRSWTLTASDNLTIWTTLDTQTLVPNWNTSESRIYNFSNSVPYRYYNFTVTYTNTSNI